MPSSSVQKKNGAPSATLGAPRLPQLKYVRKPLQRCGLRCRLL